MMNLPTLPTDNLYKFLALSGLAIALFSIVFPLTRISEIRIKLIEVGTQQDILDIEIEELKEDTDRWAKKASLNPEETMSLHKRLIETKIKKAESGGRIKQVDALIKDLNFTFKLLKVGAPLGVVMGFLGFLLWYFRVQKPNDLLLQKQLESDKINKP